MRKQQFVALILFNLHNRILDFLLLFPQLSQEFIIEIRLQPAVLHSHAKVLLRLEI